MFKKGQLVRSKRSGDLFIVDWSYKTSCYAQRLVPLMFTRLHFFNTDLELIGNNYRAKPQCSR